MAASSHFSFIDRWDIYNFLCIKDVDKIIESFNPSTLLPVIIPDGSNCIILCYDMRVIDNVESTINSIISSNRGFTEFTLMLYNMSMSYENMASICNLLIKETHNCLSNLYMLKCSFDITDFNNKATKQRLLDLIKIKDYYDDYDFVELHNVMISKERNPGYEVLFCALSKFKPQSINFKDFNVLSDEEFKMFDRLLRWYKNHEIYIKLRLFDTTDTQFNKLLKIIEDKNSTIIGLNVSSECIKTEEQLKNICDALTHNSSITSLKLSSSIENGNVGYNLSKIIKSNSTLTSLDISDCYIGTQYYPCSNKCVYVKESAFFDALSKNTTLTNLSMWINVSRMLSDFSEMIGSNVGLTSINCSTRSIKVYDDFESEISKYINNNSTLISLGITRYTTKDEWEDWIGEGRCPSYYHTSYPISEEDEED